MAGDDSMGEGVGSHVTSSEFGTHETSGVGAVLVGPWPDLRPPGWPVRTVPDLDAIRPDDRVVVLHESVVSTSSLARLAGLAAPGSRAAVVAVCGSRERVAGLLTAGVHEILDPPANDPAALARAMDRARLRRALAPPPAGAAAGASIVDRRRLREASRQLQAMEEQQRRFVSGLSHEIRTPLTSILGFAELLERSPAELTPERRDACVRAIAGNADRLRLLLDDVLLLQNPDDLRLQPEPVLLRSLVRDVVALIRRGATQNLVPGELTVHADRRRLLRAVEAIVGNVERHAGPDATLTVEADADTGGVSVVFLDDGPGIPESLREDVFRPFLQAGGGASDVQGVGLGLAVAATIVEAHGGDIRAEAPPGGGTRIRLTLPGAAGVT